MPRVCVHQIGTDFQVSTNAYIRFIFLYNVMSYVGILLGYVKVRVKNEFFHAQEDNVAEITRKRKQRNMWIPVFRGNGMDV
jgi:hypothetical protein